MSINFPEPDWKILTRLKPLALERLCQRILQGAGNILDRAQAGEQHHAYLDLYQHVHDNDAKVTDCFNDWKRSRAIEILIHWRREHLITDEEFSTFSSDTCNIVNLWLKRYES